MKNINAIRILISKGRINKALLILVDQFQAHILKDSIIALSARYNLLEEKKSRRAITSENATVEENIITYNILNLLNEIDVIQADVILVNVNQALDEKSALKKLLEILNEAYLGFSSQSTIRDKLYNDIKKRLDIEETLEYEDFFHRYYSKMNSEELEYHNSIRDYTINILNKYNKKALELILGNDTLIEKVPTLKKLERHLLVWLGKFERLFKNTPSLSLVYVGVDESHPIPRKKVPFPFGIEDELKKYLEK